MNISQATSFLKRNLVAGKDFAGVEQSRAEANRVDAELGKIHADTLDIRQELSELEKDAVLKPPSFKDVSNKQLFAATISGGAVLGGTIGVLSSIASGPAQVSFNEVRHDIIQPKLNGAGFRIETFTTGGTPQNPHGWDVDFKGRLPLVNEKVGEYTTREPVGSQTSSVLVSGALGLGIGAAGGAVVGVVGYGLRKALKQEFVEGNARKTEGDNRVLIAAGATGAVIGAAAGAVSALVQSNTVSYETQSIAMENKVIGHVPHGANLPEAGFHIPNRGNNSVPANAEDVARLMNGNFDRHGRNGFAGLDNLRPEEVRADVPKRGMFGRLDINTEEKTTSVGPSMIGSIAGGAVIGGVTGVAGGVLLNVLRKTL